MTSNNPRQVELFQPGAEADTDDGWRTYPLGDLARFLSGGTPSKDVAAYWGGDVPWLTAKDMKSVRLAKASVHVTEAGIRNGTRLAPPGAVLILTRGMALFRRIPVGIATRAVAFNQDIKALVAGPAIDPEFLLHSLVARRNRLLELVDSAGHGTGRLSTERLKALPLHVPPLAEQREIAAVLSKLDRLAELTRRLTRAKRRRKQALMQRLLTGRSRFPDHSDEAWRTVALGDIFNERNETGRADLPLLAITGNEGVVPRDSLERRDTSSADKGRYLRIGPGDIGYNTMRMWQGVSAVSRLEGIVSPAYTVCVPDASVDAEFMAYLFKFPPVVHLFRRHSQGLVNDTRSLKFQLFARIRVTIPGLGEQQRIAEVLRACDREIAVLRRKRDALERQKRALMQRLLAPRDHAA